MRIAFITNMCNHYRKKTFETFSQYYDVDFYFFSKGGEWYWLKKHGIFSGNFKYEYLPGFRLGNTYINPTLPTRLYNGNYDVIIKCINGRFTLPATYLTARILNKPFILWTGIWMTLKSPAHKLFFPITRYLYHNAHAIVTYGVHVKDYLIRQGVRSNKIFIASQAIDNSHYRVKISQTEKLALRKQLEIPSEYKILIYIGRLEAEKGLSYLIKAFSLMHHQKTILLIGGEGSLKIELEKLARRLGILNRVRFTGYISSEKTVDYYAISHIFTLPSITTGMMREPWGLVVNEAFNQGLPAVVTNSVGAAAGGLVQDDVTGIVVPERNCEALATAFDRLIGDESLRSRLGSNAKQTIASWDNEKLVSGFRKAIEFVT